MPWNDPRRDIAVKLKTQRELFLVAERGGEVVGAAMAGDDGHRGWVYYLAVAPTLQRSGIGRVLMAAVERALRRRGCQKLNLNVRTNNLKAVGFYEALGYERSEVITLGKRFDG